MKTPVKLIILLFTLTLALGTLVLLSASDDVLRRFRWFVYNDPLQLIADVTLSLRTSSGLWYGWISLSAMIIVGVTIKLVMNAELRAFSNRLVEAEVAKAELEAALQDSLWKEKHARGAKDAAMKDLEATVGKLMVAAHQLMESQQLVEIQDKELTALRSHANIPGEQLSALAAGSAQQQQKLRDELKQTTELLQAQDAAAREIEKNLNGKVHGLEAQLSSKEKLLKKHENDLKTLQQELTKIRAAKTQADNALAEELKKEKQALQTKDSAIKDLENNLAAKIRTLTSQLSEKQDLLQSRGLELETLKAEVNALTKEAADAASAKDRAENVLQQELRKKNRTVDVERRCIQRVAGKFNGESL